MEESHRQERTRWSHKNHLPLLVTIVESVEVFLRWNHFSVLVVCGLRRLSAPWSIVCCHGSTTSSSTIDVPIVYQPDSQLIHGEHLLTYFNHVYTSCNCNSLNVSRLKRSNCLLLVKSSFLFDLSFLNRGSKFFHQKWHHRHTVRLEKNIVDHKCDKLLQQLRLQNIFFHCLFISSEWCQICETISKEGRKNLSCKKLWRLSRARDNRVELLSADIRRVGVASPWQTWILFFSFCF